MTPEQLEVLLRECECTYLDFKRSQYAFAGASDEAKSELLKDILSFANQETASCAYIIIGAEERRGHRAIIHGESNHLDDHSLQQFVNAKSSHPIRFRYMVVPCDNLTLGVIEIHSQPFVFLKAPFGKLQRNVVYVRHGIRLEEESIKALPSARFPDKFIGLP